MPELEEFETAITQHTMLHEQMNRFSTVSAATHPMAIMVGVVGALSAFYHDSTDINDEEQRRIASRRLIAKIPTIAAMAYKYSIGQPFVIRAMIWIMPQFLAYVLFVPCEEMNISPVLARAMDRIFILHADHEQNASTSTVRLAVHRVQPVCLCCCRYCLPVGPEPRRCQ